MYCIIIYHFLKRNLYGNRANGGGGRRGVLSIKFQLPSENEERKERKNESGGKALGRGTIDRRGRARAGARCTACMEWGEALSNRQMVRGK